MKIAVVGATGMVGNVMLEVLAARKIKFDDLILVASERSIGKKVSFQGSTYSVIGLNEALYLKPDIAFFSAKYIARSFLFPLNTFFSAASSILGFLIINFRPVFFSNFFLEGELEPNIIFIPGSLYS